MSEMLSYLTTHEEQFRRFACRLLPLMLPSLLIHCFRNRLAALYSDFRHLRATNPDGYSANIEAWRKGLADAAREGCIPSQGTSGNLLVLKVDEELLRALETKEWGRPLALGTVVRDAISTKDMMPLQEFMAAKESIYHKSWTVRPWSVLSWGLKQLGLAQGQSGEDRLPVGKLVIVSNVEDASRELAGRIDDMTSRTERIYSKKLFYKAFANILQTKTPMSQADVEILLKYMARDKSLLAYDGQTIKFKEPAESVAPVITAEDTTIASLKTLMADLESQINTLSRRVDELAVAARDAVSRSNRAAALAALRSKKTAESNLTRQSATLGQLEEVYVKIGQAADQIGLVRILEGSTGVLKAFNAEVGGVERVDDVVDQLKEQMTQVEEISSVITEVGQGGLVDEDEVDVELQAIEREDKEKKDTKERLEKEKREQDEAAETRRKLKSLEAIEGHAVRDRLESNNDMLERIQSVNSDIDAGAARLERMSLDSPREAEKAT